jgi:hypothetical protein
MKSRALLLAAPTAILLLLGAGGREIPLLDRWMGPTVKPGAFKTLLIIGISGNPEVRNHFEDQFVSHLRGRGVQAVTSYSIVPELRTPGDRERILRMIRDQDVDAAITVRAVPLADTTEAEWAGAWKRSAAEGGTIRELVQKTLPLSGQKARQYGVEVALWEADHWTKIWGARTGSYSRRQLTKRAGELVRTVMEDLTGAGLL